MYFLKAAAVSSPFLACYICKHLRDKSMYSRTCTNIACTSKFVQILHVDFIICHSARFNYSIIFICLIGYWCANQYMVLTVCFQKLMHAFISNSRLNIWYGPVVRTWLQTLPSRFSRWLLWKMKRLLRYIQSTIRFHGIIVALPALLQCKSSRFFNGEKHNFFLYDSF